MLGIAIKNNDESDKSITFVRSNDAPTIANEQKISLYKSSIDFFSPKINVIALTP